MTRIRVLLGAVGVAAGLYGVLLLLDLGGENLRATGIWLVGGVILHDAVLAPATVLLAYGAAWVAGRVTGRRLPAPVIVGAVVLGAATLVAVPVLGREQARPNPTLLDRDYVLGWWVLAGLTLVVVVGALLRDRVRRRGGADGTRAGRR